MTDKTHLVKRRNFLLGVINGTFSQLGMNLTYPSLVLAVFIRALGGSNTLVGLLPAIRFGGWFLPQFLAAGPIQPRRRKVPLAVGLEAGRMAIYATLGLLTYTLARAHEQLLLVLFFVLFSLSRLTAGTGALTRTDVIGKIVKPARRAAFFAQRNFWGGLVVFAAGFGIRYVLDEPHGLTFPLNFALLFGLSATSFLLAWLAFARVKEPAGPPGQPRHSLKEQLARTPRLLRKDPDFRRYLQVRILLNMTRLAAPFYPILAIDMLGAPASMVGFYLSAMVLARTVANPLWQRLNRGRDRYFLTKASALLTVLEPLLAIALPWLIRLGGPSISHYRLLPAYLFTIVFLIAGASQSGRSIGLMALLLDLAPPQERASYIGFVNTVLGLVSFLPIVAGTLIDRIGFEAIFVTAAGLLLWGYLTTLGWKRAPVAPR